MFKKLTAAVKDTIKQSADNIVSNVNRSIEIQEHMSQVIKTMEGKKSLWVWSHEYWDRHDSSGKVKPITDRHAYLNKGKTFKPGKVYRMGPMFEADFSIGAKVGDIGTVYNLDNLKAPAEFAVAKDKENVMLFNWVD